MLREAGVQVDHVRHDGRADDAHGQEDGVASGQARNEGVQEDLAPIGLGQEGLDHVAQRDDSRRAADEELQSAEAPLRHREDGEDEDSRDPRRKEQGNVKQQIEPYRRPEELSEVGRHGGELLRDPQDVADPSGEAYSAHLGEVLPRGDPQLRGKALQEHGHQVGQEDHPQEGIAELGAALDVGGEVSGVYVGDGGDEGGTEEGQDGEEPSPPAADRFPGGGLQLGVRVRLICDDCARLRHFILLLGVFAR